MKTYKFYTIVQTPDQQQMNKLMHFSAIFESGKQLGVLKEVSIKTNSKIKSPHDAVSALKKLYEMLGGKVLLLLEKESGESYFMEKIQTISNGNQFILFHDMLKKLGFDVHTDEFMCVIDIIHKNELV